MIESIGQWVASDPNAALAWIMFWLIFFGVAVVIDLATDEG